MKKQPKLKYDEYGELIEKNRARTAFNFATAAISVLIFAVVLWRLWQARDSDVVSSVIRTKPVGRAIAQNELCVALPGSVPPFYSGDAGPLTVRVSEPTTTMDAEGRIQIRSIHLLSFADTLQLSVKLNNKYLNCENLDFYLKVIRPDLTVSLVRCGERLTDKRSDYSFLRLDFPSCSVGEKDTVRLIVTPAGSGADAKALLNLKIVSPDVYSHKEKLTDFKLAEP